MTVEPTEPTTPDPAPTDPNEPATGNLGDPGKKALDAERRAKREAEKRASDLEARLKEFEDRDKSESQRMAERAEAAEKALTDAQSRALRLEVAAEKGLTPAQAKRLVGSTREELEADAAELLETFAPAGASESTADPLDLGIRGKPSTQAGPGADFAKFLSGQLKR